jgi:hypothetical protein
MRTAKSMPADYHASNFYPQVEDRPESRYGAFVQLLGVRAGEGRIAAFTDSTIWSNFCYFEPGKSELSVGLVEWLNHRQKHRYLNGWMIVLGFVSALGSIALAFAWDGGWIIQCGRNALVDNQRVGHRGKSSPCHARSQASSAADAVIVDRTTSEVILPSGWVYRREIRGIWHF